MPNKDEERGVYGIKETVLARWELRTFNYFKVINYFNGMYILNCSQWI